MSYNQGNLSFKVGTTPFSATGLSLINAASAAGARSTLGLDTGNSPTFTDLTLTGNLTVNGVRTTVGGETTAFSDNYLNLNSGYTADAAQSVGIVANYDPTTVTTTVNGSYVAGINATSNPTVGTTGAATFSAGDIIQITASAGGKNDGFFEVQSHSSNVLTIKGIGTVGPSEEWSQNQFTAGSSDGANITKVNVSVIRCDSTGTWQLGKGASAPLSYLAISTSAPYVAGNGLTLTGSTFDVGAGNGISVLSDSVQIQLDGTTLLVGGPGLKVNTGGITSNELAGGAVTLAKFSRSSSTGQVLIGQGSGADAQWQAFAGDVTVDGAGNTAIANNAVTTAKINNAAVTAAKADLTGAWAHTGLLSANGGFAVKVTVTTTNYTAVAADVLIGVTDTTAARTITLYAISGNVGKVLVIKDMTGAAATNNITVDANASETIDGALTYAINTNYGSVTLVCDVAGWFIV